MNSSLRMNRLSIQFTAFVATAMVLNAVAADKDSEEGFVSLFNGKDLTGWEGNFDLWKVKDKCIVGDSPGIEHNQFLATIEKYDDFELRLEFRLKDGIGNTGVQFRSSRVKDSTEVRGYQADIGEKYWGCLYDESRRRKVLIQAPEKLYDILKLDDWNTYVIRAEGSRVKLEMNGFETVDYVEDDAEIERDGIIALQVHSGPPLKIEFRNIRIKKL
ncbi:MAG: DUF1080 domain-containing protein [Planctomycetota bacterium]|nr:DUF1080 domain-containing protein [Planctomycetota bacterium]MDA1213233.1 DUF1080 domain-containing protein [Planctomycetota bacterium]